MVSALHVHLIFVTKYRRSLLRPEHHNPIEHVFAKARSDFGATPVEPNGQDDHVHLLVEYLPTVAISALVNSFNSVSSRRLRQRFQMRTHRTASPGGPPLSKIRQ